jgi:hypothetical protein
MTTKVKAFPVFECDSHIAEPPVIWEHHEPVKLPW